MGDENEKKFGKRGAAPPVVTHRPKIPGEKPPARNQKRSLVVPLIALGALSLGTSIIIDWLDRKLNCAPDPNNPGELICKHRSGSTYRRSRSSRWHFSSGSHTSSSHGFSFGGFGHSGGGFHFGGG